MTLVVNLYGGPGTGKSTMAARVFATLKRMGINCEMTREFAKDAVWEDSMNVLNDQIYVFGCQHHRLHVLQNNVDVVLCDSPLLLQLVYCKKTVKEFDALKRLALEIHNNMDTLDIFLHRTEKYSNNGRYESKYEARLLDRQIGRLLLDYDIPHYRLGTDMIHDVLDLVLHKMG